MDTEYIAIRVACWGNDDFLFLGPKMLKLAFGSVKIESGTWDLPQEASIYRWPHLFIDRSASIYRWPHLFIDGPASIYR